MEQCAELGYDANQNPIYETIYMGQNFTGMPVGVMKQSGSAGSATLAVSVYNVYADQIGAPRVITRQSDEVIVWRWDQAEPFGATEPNDNPSGLGAFTFNQRLPGQVFDAESGLFQNWNREYSPRIGRYMQSDPIGLQGGINTFSYINGNPLKYTDPRGLAIGDMPPPPPGYDSSWPQGQWPNGKPYVRDPNGSTWTAHPEDKGHWRHWDKQDSDGDDDGMWPPNSKKPWPGQKSRKRISARPIPTATRPLGIQPSSTRLLMIPGCGFHHGLARGPVCRE